MGATSSTASLQDAVEDAGAASVTDQPVQSGVKLFEYDKDDATCWQQLSAACHPRFYDANEDAGARKKHEWFLEVDEGDIDVRADQALGYIADLATRRLTFTAAGVIYAMRFPDTASFHAFGTELNDKVFYNTYGMENNDVNRAKELGSDFAAMFFNAGASEATWSDPMEEENDVDPRDANAEAMRERQAKQAKRTDDNEEKIHGIIIGGMENNYLMRGTRFGVMKNLPDGGGLEDMPVDFHDLNSILLLIQKDSKVILVLLQNLPDGGGLEDTPVEFQLTPQRSGRPGAAFTPSKVLLAQSERRMNLLTPDNASALHHADIETGKIVSTWTFQKDNVDIPIRDIVGDSKSSQMEDKSTFLGLDSNRLCRWDLRDARGVVQNSPVVNYEGGKDYARGTNFTCLATSGDGYVAVGATDGKVRLYSSKSLAKANTAVPGLGAAITAVDVTYDGKWVLATTAHYLMLVKTTFTTDKGEAGNGFTGRMGGRGSVPRLLRLRPEDSARTGGKAFSKGKFTWITESGQAERWIVANCGTFSVVWNFGRVKAAAGDSLSFGGLPANTDYFLQAKDEDVVDTAFLHTRYATSGAAATPGKNSVRDSPSGGGAAAASRAAYASMVIATPHSVFSHG